jgi:hypothetical protein
MNLTPIFKFITPPEIDAPHRILNGLLSFLVAVVIIFELVAVLCENFGFGTPSLLVLIKKINAFFYSLSSTQFIFEMLQFMFQDRLHWFGKRLTCSN